MLGLKIDVKESDFLPITQEEEPVSALPTNFDAREKWPQYIHPIRDQG